jgi:hypothetical protein
VTLRQAPTVVVTGIDSITTEAVSAGVRDGVESGTYPRCRAVIICDKSAIS